MIWDSAIWAAYGSEIATPVLDSLASTGIVFSNFHAAPTCSPTRAMLLTGVDHHRAGMGNMYEFLNSAPAQSDQPGYEGHLNDSVVTIAEVLKTVGYHTAISGKWHLGQQLVVEQCPWRAALINRGCYGAGGPSTYAPELLVDRLSKATCVCHIPKVGIRQNGIPTRRSSLRTRRSTNRSPSSCSRRTPRRIGHWRRRRT